MSRYKDIGDDFLSLFFPRLCMACSAHLVRGERIICTGCLLTIARTDFHSRRGNTLEQAFWGRCLIERAAAFSIYNRGSRIKTLIHELKYKGRKEIGTMLGDLYGGILSDSGFMEGIDMIVPVPLHPARQRERGYNQSDCIASGISAAAQLPVRDDIIKRLVKGGSQTQHGRYARWENVKGLFIVSKPEAITGMHLLLVDDVVTTGSTMEACVNALHEAGDVKVSIVALAAAQKLTL
ncbi:MAG: ComF family protein [Bacteroidales bacterium]|nr:ComF family protein [Bacteroidales bacterium]